MDYYEKYLGDNCDNKCDKCFADKDIYVVQEDFEVIGESVIHKVQIKKDSWYWIRYRNPTHVCLTQGTDRDLLITHELFERYFRQ